MKILQKIKSFITAKPYTEEVKVYDGNNLPDEIVDELNQPID